VLTDVENNGTQGTRWIIQVRASMRIKTLRPVCVDYIIIHWIETPSTPPFIGYGSKVYKEELGWLLLYLTKTLCLLGYLQDFIYNYILNRLGYGPPGPCP
jgi:hypothetical protein